MIDMKKILFVIDMQNDFVDGALGTKEAQAMLPNAVKKINGFDGRIIFTRDTHSENYPATQEGKKLPVTHCVRGTEGWKLVPSLEEIRTRTGSLCIDKPTFGSTDLIELLKAEYGPNPDLSFELIGICTDICVISNALLLKAAFPEVPITVDSSCCAGAMKELRNP